jgi:hypothetical protein
MLPGFPGLVELVQWRQVLPGFPGLVELVRWPPGFELVRRLLVSPGFPGLVPGLVPVKVLMILWKEPPVMKELLFLQREPFGKVLMPAKVLKLQPPVNVLMLPLEESPAKVLLFHLRESSVNVLMLLLEESPAKVLLFRLR